MEEVDMIFFAILLAIAVAIFPYVIWMSYLRGSGQGRSRRRVVPGADPHSRPNPTR